MSDHPARERVARVLEDVPLIDGHNDVPWQLRRRFDNDLSRLDFDDTRSLDPPMHIDLRRLREGRISGLFFAAYVPVECAGPGAADVMMEQLDVARRLIESHPEALELALRADDVAAIRARGRIACFLAVEGGHGIESSLDHLRAAHAAGARYLTLVHNIHTDWADCCVADPRHGGLTDFGREIVEEMNRLGMLVDLAHASPATMRDVLDVSAAPVACTHSGASAVNDYPRNVPDDILRAIRNGDGIVMATFVPAFVSAAVLRHRARRMGEEKRLRVRYPADRERREEALAAWYEHRPAPRATLAGVADHVDHLCAVMGPDHVGIGSDFDGIDEVPEGLEHIGQVPDLLVELARRGHDDAALGGIAGNNILRVLRAVEAAASQPIVERSADGATG